jgi:hypothetical protein
MDCTCLADIAKSAPAKLPSQLMAEPELQASMRARLSRIRPKGTGRGPSFEACPPAASSLVSRQANHQSKDEK